MPAPLHFASEPREIAGHMWRVVVTDSRHGGRRFLYQFAQIGALPLWQDMQEWPGFNRALPKYGLPPALRDLYFANVAACAAALDPPPEPEPESIAALLWA